MHVDASMEMHGDVCRRKVDWKIVAFLSSVVYYFGDLLKTANTAFVRHKTFISLYFNCLSSLPLILGDFKATRCVLIDIITSSSVRQPRLLRTRNGLRSFGIHLRSFMSNKKQRVHFAAFVRFRYASLLANTFAWRKAKKTEVSRFGKIRSCQDMNEIVRFLHKSLTTEEP